MRAILVILALLALATAGAGPATATTCVYRELVGADPVPRDTGNPRIDDLYVSVGYYECHPPPPDPTE